MVSVICVIALMVRVMRGLEWQCHLTKESNRKPTQAHA